MNQLSRRLYLAMIFAFFYVPIAVVIIYSFNNSTYSLVWHGFTLDWYKQLWQDSDLLTSALHSFIIAILASTIATLLGTLASVSLYRYRFYGKKLLQLLLFILIGVPEIVMAVSFLLLFTLARIPLGFWTLLLAHTTFCLPFVALTVYGRITSIDKYIFEAARDLGAGDFLIFRKVIVPLLLPAIIAGWLLSFTLSLDDVIISYFVSGPGFSILPLTIFSMVRLGIRPEINALCTVLLVITLILVSWSQVNLNKKP